MTQEYSLARPAGLDPATTGLGNRCSIHLSYGRIPGRSPASKHLMDRGRWPTPEPAGERCGRTAALKDGSTGPAVLLRRERTPCSGVDKDPASRARPRPHVPASPASRLTRRAPVSPPPPST